MNPKKDLPRCKDYEKSCITKVGVYVCAMEHQAVSDDGRIKVACHCPLVNYGG